MPRTVQHFPRNNLSYQHTFSEERRRVDEQIDGFFNAILEEEEPPQDAKKE